MKHANQVAQSFAVEAQGLGTLTLLYGLTVSNGIRTGQPLPSRLKVLNWGVNKTVKGDVIVNDLTASSLPAFQAEKNWDDVVLDIEHGSVPGSPLFLAAAANGKFPELLGRGKPLVISGQGLFVDGISWSPHGNRAYEFPDLSGAVKQDSSGVVIGLHSLAFCTHGAAEGIHSYSQQVNTTMEHTMKSILLSLLGLDEKATDAQMLEKAKTMAPAILSLSGMDPKLATALVAMTPDALQLLTSLKPETLTALSKLTAKEIEDKLALLSTIGAGKDETLQAALTRLSTAEGTLTTLKADFTSARRNTLLLSAAQQGKVVPKVYLEKHGDDLTTLSTLIEQLPVTVPVEQRVVTLSTGAPRAMTTTPTDIEARVAARFGRKPEDLKDV